MTADTKYEPANVGVRTKISALWTAMLFVFAYVVIPSLMVFGALVLRPAINRIANIALGVVYALTIVAGAVGDWSYYILAGAIEVALLAAVVYYASTWPKLGARARSG